VHVMKFIPYLVFPGQAEEAMRFYESALGGKITGLQRFGDMPGGTSDDPSGDAFKHKVMHGEVVAGGLKLYFSDSSREVAKGDNVTILIDCDSEPEVDRLYEALQVGGTVQMALEQTVWNAKYANIKDRFGVTWQLNFQYS